MHADPAIADQASFRPTATLPIGHLVRISLYWLGLTAIDGAVGLFIQNRLNFGPFAPDPLEVGRITFLLSIPVAVISILIQPTVGSISDYTVSRWGRRKPYIVIGSLLDLVFLAGIALSNTILMLGAFAALLAFSTNIARGPFQGYVPDLVPEKQVGLASAMVGLMQILGNVTGFVLVTVAVLSAAASRWRSSPSRLVELLTMAAVVARVGEGQPPKPRNGKSWGAIVREVWGTDVLKERSYVWLLTSRFFFLMGGAVLVNLHPHVPQADARPRRGRGQLDQPRDARRDRDGQRPRDHPVGEAVGSDRAQSRSSTPAARSVSSGVALAALAPAIPSPSSAARCSARRPARSWRSTGR